MDLLGPFGGLFWLGLLMIGGGFTLAYRTVARHGGLDRTKTLHVIFDDDSPMKRPEAGSDHRRFLAGVFIAAFGLVNLFTGVTTGDMRERAVCAQACRREGFPAGGFGPSAVERRPDGVPERACWCVGPAGSRELPQTQLRPPSAPALPVGH